MKMLYKLYHATVVNKTETETETEIETELKCPNPIWVQRLQKMSMKFRPQFSDTTVYTN